MPLWTVGWHGWLPCSIVQRWPFSRRGAFCLSRAITKAARQTKMCFLSPYDYMHHLPPWCCFNWYNESEGSYIYIDISSWRHVSSLSGFIRHIGSRCICMCVCKINLFPFVNTCLFFSKTVFVSPANAFLSRMSYPVITGLPHAYTKEVQIYTRNSSNRASGRDQPTISRAFRWSW